MIAASVASAAMAVEKVTEIGASTGTPLDPSGGCSARITGAGPVVIVQWWSTEFTTPLGSLMPPARVNVYDVLGAKIARGWSRVKPVSPESQTIRQGASGLAPKAASRSQDWNRPVHREPAPRPKRDHRPVELDGDRRVGGHAHRPAVGDQLDDLRRAAEAPGQRARTSARRSPRERPGARRRRDGCARAG